MERKQPSEISLLEAAVILGVSCERIHYMRNQSSSVYRPYFPKGLKRNNKIYFKTSDILEWKHKVETKHWHTLSDYEKEQDRKQKAESILSFDNILNRYRIFEMRKNSH